MKKGLCYRCEYRARYLEVGHAPRYECGVIQDAKNGCYMYRPVKPVVTTCDEDDFRPRLGAPMMSKREYFHSVAGDVVLRLYTSGDNAMLYWFPKEKDGE